MDNNICRFISKSSTEADLHPVNFVLETKIFPFNGLVTLSLYRMVLVKRGIGTLQIPGNSFPLREGDIFFLSPSLPYYIDSDGGFEYMYISYLGAKATMIMDKLGVNSQNIIFHGFRDLIPLWEKALAAQNTATLGIRTEGLLLYSFSVLGENLMKFENNGKTADAASLIKKYIDDHYCDSELTLEKISRELSYNKKYLSSVFKKAFKVNLSSYLNTIRVQHALTFMEQNFTSIKDISYLCGFRDQLYFAKVFKSKIGMTPKEYITQLKK